jgi:hypothetical protein
VDTTQLFAVYPTNFCGLCYAIFTENDQYQGKMLNVESSLPVPVAARCKAGFCGRWPGGIARSNPTGGMDVCCCECCVLSGRGLCDGLITRSEESYRLWCFSVIVKPRHRGDPDPLGAIGTWKREDMSVRQLTAWTMFIQEICTVFNRLGQYGFY